MSGTTVNMWLRVAIESLKGALKLLDADSEDAEVLGEILDDLRAEVGSRFPLRESPAKTDVQRRERLRPFAVTRADFDPNANRGRA